MNNGVEVELVIVVTARSTCVEFVVTTVINDDGWLGLLVRKSFTVHNCPMLIGCYTL